jgi:hypothetical protein
LTLTVRPELVGQFSEQRNLRLACLRLRAGTFETGFCDWQAGDEFRGEGNVRYRITAVIPLPLIAESNT